VLEFGPANGRMTRFLNESLGCEVYLVEIDEEAGREALVYAKDLVVGDIEQYEWLSKYASLRFDYITFADVLEHLRDPEKVLIEAKGLLKQDGSVLFSVPNLAHNSVLISLMNHEFEYSATGLLDNTHIHFFTKNSIEHAMQRTGYHVAKRYATYAPVGATEIPVSYGAVPGIDETFWKSREYGDVYQFIYEVKKGSEFIEATENYLRHGIYSYYIQIFFDYGQGYDEAGSRTFVVESLSSVQELEFDMTEDIRGIRFDPFNRSCMVDVEAFVDVENGEERPLRLMSSNADVRDGNRYVFTCEDPMMLYGPAHGRRFHHVRLRLRYISVDAIKVAAIREFFAAVVGDYDKQIQKMHTEIELNKVSTVDYEKLISDEKRVSAGLQKEVEARDALIRELMGSTSWRLTKPFRKIGDILHRRGRGGR
jgi:SAM-dependent methyltransferase